MVTGISTCVVCDIDVVVLIISFFHFYSFVVVVVGQQESIEARCRCLSTTF